MFTSKRQGGGGIGRVGCCEREKKAMAMVVMQASGIGIRAILTSMILKPFLCVVVVVSGAQTAGDG